jgi:hypothetical protein
MAAVIPKTNIPGLFAAILALDRQCIPTPVSIGQTDQGFQGQGVGAAYKGSGLTFTAPSWSALPFPLPWPASAPSWPFSALSAAGFRWRAS